MARNGDDCGAEDIIYVMIMRIKYYYLHDGRTGIPLSTLI